jgi:hypothetical protein
MNSPMSDVEASDFYADPANQGVAPGPAVRPPRPKALGGSIPVRFPPSSVEAIKQLADADGVTVSGWVRQVVDAELRRRQGTATQRADVAEELERLARQLRASA